MQVIETTFLTTAQKELMCKLWNQEYPASVSYQNLADFNGYLNQLQGITHYLLKSSAGEIEGWAFTFTRDNEKWFAIILDRKAQGRGKGAFLLSKLKEKEQKLCGWVVDHNNYVKQNGQRYSSPLPFYLKNGFTICSEIRLETENLSAVKIIWEKNKVNS